MGESGLNDAAVSPAGAIGLWQIMPFNAGPYGYAPGDLYNPGVNAHIAVAMSGGGTNCAAWDSAYLDIYASGRYSFLAWPERGSADYNNLPAAAAELAGHGLRGMTPPDSPGIAQTLAGTTARWQQVGGRLVPAASLQLAQQVAIVQRMYRRGWRA